MSVIGDSIEVYKNMAKSATQDSINYKKRIDKAIEELELWKPKNKVIKTEIDYLLEILKGSDKE